VNYLAPLFGGTNDQRKCFDCIADTVSSGQTYAQSNLSCTTDNRAPFAFNGQTPQMILSRYPLSNSQEFVFGSTNFRRAILYSQVQLQGGSKVDFYCVQLSSPLLDQDLPYVGNYAGAHPPATGYDGEQLLQVQKLIAFVKKTSGNTPAIIAGDWHSSIKSDNVDAVAPDTLTLLRQTYTQASPASWTPQCTYCSSPQNPFNGTGFVGYAFEDTFLSNWPANATTDESVIFNQQVVHTASGTEMLSPSFGSNVRIIRP
jgi:hypothetical protein